jgi:Protein of unknown function (DUF2442)
MRRSSVRGARTSADVEVLGLTPRALWILVGDRELMIDFVRFPWFERASIEDVRDVVLLHGQHLHWPRLDVDLHVDSIDHPERFPLLDRSAPKRAPSTKSRARRG